MGGLQNISTKICGKKKEQCYLKAKSDIETSGYVRSFCKCLPGCFEISYSQEHSLGDLANPELIKAYYNRTSKVHHMKIVNSHMVECIDERRNVSRSKIYVDIRDAVLESLVRTNLLILHFYFASGQIRSYQKSELFGFTEFLCKFSIRTSQKRNVIIDPVLI